MTELISFTSGEWIVHNSEEDEDGVDTGEGDEETVEEALSSNLG